MNDRIPLYPGRVTLTPVDGQPNIYDMVRADEATQDGTPLRKSTLLKDTTAEQYGLDSSAVPDDILSWLGRYNEHWWSALHGEAVYGYSGAETEYTKDDDGSYYHFFAYNTSSKKYTYNFSYSDKISVDAATGDISLVAPVEFTYDESGSFVLSDVLSLIATTVAGKYVTGLRQNSSSTGYNDADSGTVSDAVFFIPADADSGLNKTNKTITTRTGGSDDQKKNVLLGWDDAVTVKALKVTAAYGLLADAGETTYEHSLNRNEYPDSGEQDGVTYTYLGVPFEKFPTAPKIETGEYVGTGVYGSGNENSLTFSFVPKIVIIGATFTKSSGSGAYQVYTAIFIRDRACNIGSYRTSTNTGSILPYLPTTWEEKTLSWYNSSSAAYQLNESGAAYEYLAIG